MKGTPVMSKKFTDELFSKIVDEDNLYNAYKKSLNNNGKYNPDAMVFALDEVYNLMKLRQSLIAKFDFLYLVKKSNSTVIKIDTSKL